MSDEYCPTCGAKTVEYTQTLCKGLIRGLVKAFRASRLSKFEIGNVPGLTYSQRENLRKLQYWDVIVKADESSPKGGEWYITTTGRRFLTGEVALYKKVITYRGRVQRFEGKRVFIEDVTGGWKYRPEYAQEAVPHGKLL